MTKTPDPSARRAALYLRVSTDGQTTENQRLALRETAERRGWRIIAEYEDAGISGAKGRDKRPAFDRMLKDAARRRFDVLMVVAMDRLGRSVATVATALDELVNAGVRLFSLREDIDGTSPYGRAMLHMATVFAELERHAIRDRVRAGLARARAKGRRLGRPRIAPEREAAIRDHLRAGHGILATAKALGVGASVVQRVRREMGTVAEASG